jgi:Peroxisome biogenesis factor 1, N-terminal
MIQTKSLSTNFINIPSSESKVLKFQNQKYFLSSQIPSEKGIVIDIQVALSNEISGCESVEYLLPHEIPRANSVTVKPKTPSDWEVISLNSEIFENIFMSQCRLVFPKQIVVLWFKSLIVRVEVVTGFGMLVEGSEIAVEGNERRVCWSRVLRVIEGNF